MNHRFSRYFILAVPFAIFLISMELGGYLLLRLHIMPSELPTYLASNIRSKFWMDMDSHFGPWHMPHSRYHHRRACFEADYRANSAGMRDPERQIDAEGHRTVVLGDSFIEGYGLSDDKRLTALLEKKTGEEFLNFGTSGHFGPTQYYLLYKHKARHFSHDRVLVGIFPQNDFSDERYDIWKDSGRRRPFFVGDHPNYNLIYSEGEYGDKPDTVWRDLKGFLREFTHAYYIVDYIDRLLKYKLKRYFNQKKGTNFSGFYDFTEESWNRLFFVMGKIMEEADGKAVVFFFIPAVVDMQNYDAKGEAPLSKKLAEFGREHQAEIIDLLPLMHRHQGDWKKYFFSCDGHWSEYGNEVASRLILSRIARN